MAMREEGVQCELSEQTGKVCPCRVRPSITSALFTALRAGVPIPGLEPSSIKAQLIPGSYLSLGELTVPLWASPPAPTCQLFQS